MCDGTQSVTTTPHLILLHLPFPPRLLLIPTEPPSPSIDPALISEPPVILHRPCTHIRAPIILHRPRTHIRASLLSEASFPPLMLLLHPSWEGSLHCTNDTSNVSPSHRPLCLFCSLTTGSSAFRERRVVAVNLSPTGLIGGREHFSRQKTSLEVTGDLLRSHNGDYWPPRDLHWHFPDPQCASAELTLDTG